MLELPSCGNWLHVTNLLLVVKHRFLNLSLITRPEMMQMVTVKVKSVLCNFKSTQTGLMGSITMPCGLSVA